jgi:uncharacterized cupin superfamily protein
MADGWTHVRPSGTSSRDDKPGERFELADELGLEEFNLNVASLEPGERLSQNHFHFHENQAELIYVAAGRCRVDVDDDRFVAEPNDVVRFDAGRDGAHLVHNPFEEPVRLLALGWPPEGRRPVKQVKSIDELLAEREE